MHNHRAECSAGSSIGYLPALEKGHGLRRVDSARSVCCLREHLVVVQLPPLHKVPLVQQVVKSLCGWDCGGLRVESSGLGGWGKCRWFSWSHRILTKQASRGLWGGPEWVGPSVLVTHCTSLWLDMVLLAILSKLKCSMPTSCPLSLRPCLAFCISHPACPPHLRTKRCATREGVKSGGGEGLVSAEIGAGAALFLARVRS